LGEDVIDCAYDGLDRDAFILELEEIWDDFACFDSVS
jgi:hypothetical protein